MLLDRERDRRTAATSTPAEPAALLCSACGHRITDDAERIDMNGAHEHTFVNPGGFVHHLGCFSQAPGCVYRGTTESAFSWFPGFTWQIAVCASCQAHLGWRFSTAADAFHGLIVTALRRA